MLQEKDHRLFARIASAVLADDDEFFRMAMRQILTRRLGVARVSEVSSFEEAVNILATDDGADIVLLDLDLLGVDMRTSIRTVRRMLPATRVVVLASSLCQADILRCLEAGVHGYVHKGSGVAAMMAALHTVCSGNVHVPSFLPDLWTETDDAPATVERSCRQEGLVIPRLSKRQREVLELLVKGMSNKGIARQLALSEGAVKFHLSALFGHLGVGNRVQAASRGARVLADQPT